MKRSSLFCLIAIGTLLPATTFADAGSQRVLRSRTGGSGMVHSLKNNAESDSNQDPGVSLPAEARARLSNKDLDRGQGAIKRIPRSRSGGSGMVRYQKFSQTESDS